MYAVYVRLIYTCYTYVQEGYIIHIGQQVTVRSGDTLDKLAARFGTTLRQV
jgi:LysM repeat protein